LRHVEIVGGGYMHNDTLQSAALQIIYRSPTIDRVNVTNSSMHGVQVGFRSCRLTVFVLFEGDRTEG
jgi:hypothetical protein